MKFCAKMQKSFWHKTRPAMPALFLVFRKIFVLFKCLCDRIERIGKVMKPALGGDGKTIGGSSELGIHERGCGIISGRGERIGKVANGPPERVSVIVYDILRKRILRNQLGIERKVGFAAVRIVQENGIGCGCLALKYGA